MTVGTQTPRVEYIEDGVATTFPIPYAFFDPTDLIVSRLVDATDSGEFTLTLDVDFSIAGGDVGDGPNVGTLTLLTAGVAAATLRIDRWTKRSQELHYQPGDDFPARSHEDGLDRLEMQIQELTRDQLTREQIVDYLADYVLKAGTGIRIDYDDNANTITITATGIEETVAALPDCLELSGDEQTFTGDSGSPGTGGLTVEDVQDILAAMIVDGDGINTVYNDGTGTLTITNTGGGGGGGGFTLPDVLASAAAVGIDDNQLWVGTGHEAMGTIPITPFMQGFMNEATAAAALAALGGIAIVAASYGSPGYVKLSNDLVIQWGSQSITGNSEPTIPFPHALSSFAVPVGSGGHDGTSNPNNIRVISTTLTGFKVCNNDPDPATFFWIAIGI